MVIQNMKKAFQEPDRRYAVYQIIHEGVADKNRIARYDDQWFAGVVGNVKYPVDFPDNKMIWDSAAAGIREYVSRGMHVWLYDEKGYPSGTGGFSPSCSRMGKA